LIYFLQLRKITILLKALILTKYLSTYN